MTKISAAIPEKKNNEDLFRIATYVILFVTTLVFIISETVPKGSTPFYFTILFLAVILILNIFSGEIEKMFSSQRKAQIIFLIISAILILLTAWVGKFFNIIFLVFMFASQAYMMLKFIEATILTFVEVLGYIFILKGLGVPWLGIVDLGFSLVVGLVFVITLSLVLGQYAKQTERAESLNQQLIMARQKEKELAAAEERVRLARDIHDGLGHHLTTLNIQLQAAEKLINTKPDKALQAIQISRQEAKAALEEVRRSVAVMRSTPLDGKTLSEAVQNLVIEYQRTSDAEIILNISPLPEPLNLQISDTLYRCIQEGLTNIKKHAANTTQILIDLEWSQPTLICTIKDNGSQAASDQVNSGFGLAGIRERVEQLGGQFMTQQLHPQGFLLTIKIDISGAGHD